MILLRKLAFQYNYERNDKRKGHRLMLKLSIESRHKKPQIIKTLVRF